MHPTQAIIQSIITEKSSRIQEKGTYTFLVKPAATKVDIKNAVKMVYGAEVKDVRIINSPKKTRLIGRGRLWTKRPSFKKAIITLKAGKSIDPHKIEPAKTEKSK